ncbi:MAG: hypothetical protein GXP55_00265, partial [Deltaproteobacteria bacterium]|nr:hypothetical protein [Deltaproteobacteria bacterium]
MSCIFFRVRLALGFACAVTLLFSGASPASAQVKPRIVIAFDTSGSMALDFGGTPTFGDGVMTNCTGSPGNPYCGANCTAGIDTDCDGLPNDSRITIAKNALRNMVLAFGDVEWSLARFAQNEGTNISCPIVDNLECTLAFGPGSFYITSYGNPQCNSGGSIPRNSCNYNFNFPGLWPAACRPGSGGRPPLRMFGGGSPTVCGNYAGQCGNGDFLVNFPGIGAFAGLDNESALLKWIDNQETNFNTSTASGNFCNHRGGGDCELRPEGGTPIAGLLDSIGNNVAPIQAADTASSCRPYSVILLTDGQESRGCHGGSQAAADAAPPAAAAALLAAGIRTYVVGLAIAGGSQAKLNAIATAGGTDAGAAGGDTAFFANNQTELAAGLADIVRRSLLIETCNGLDDNCNALYDEGFPLFCNRPAGVTTVPNYTSPHPAAACVDPGETVCDGFDDNCNGLIDEGFTKYCDIPGHAAVDLCVNPGEVCDGIDNNCNGV